MTSKLTALIEAAKAADFDGVQTQAVYEANERFEYIANPATILELCALLEKAEEALREWNLAADNSEETEYDDMASYVIPMPIFCDANEKMEEALAAIKQWKEQI